MLKYITNNKCVEFRFLLFFSPLHTHCLIDGSWVITETNTKIQCKTKIKSISSILTTFVWNSALNLTLLDRHFLFNNFMENYQFRSVVLL